MAATANPFYSVAPAPPTGPPPPGPPPGPPPIQQAPESAPPVASAVPDPPIEPNFNPIGKRFNARHSHEPRSQDELLVAVGDVVEVHVNYGDGWGLSSNHTARKTAVMPFIVLGEEYAAAIRAADQTAGAPPAYSAISGDVNHVPAPAAPPRAASSYTELLHIADATSPDPQKPGLRTLSLVFREPADLQIVGPLANNNLAEQKCGYKSKRGNGGMMYLQYVPRVSSLRPLQKKLPKAESTGSRLLTLYIFPFGGKHFLFSDPEIFKEARKLFPNKTEAMWAQILSTRFFQPLCANGKARVAVIDVGGVPDHHIIFLIRSTTPPTSYPTFRPPAKFSGQELSVPQVSATPLYQLQETAPPPPGLPPLDDQTRTRWAVQVGAVFRGVYKVMGQGVRSPYAIVDVVPCYGYGYGYYDPTALMLMSLMWSPFYGYGFGYGWIAGSVVISVAQAISDREMLDLTTEVALVEAIGVEMRGVMWVEISVTVEEILEGEVETSVVVVEILEGEDLAGTGEEEEAILVAAAASAVILVEAE
ncbi:hypothetical protein HDU93_008420, partial [Gonapodya sp. JEL0774]